MGSASTPSKRTPPSLQLARMQILDAASLYAQCQIRGSKTRAGGLYKQIKAAEVAYVMARDFLISAQESC